MKLSLAIHSYRGGTGKSTTTANLATSLATMGFKVATIDLDLSSPGLHVIYNVNQSMLNGTLNDFLYGKCSLEKCVLNITKSLELHGGGELLFIGSSMKPEEIANLMKKEYEENVFKIIGEELEKKYSIDYLIFDTHPGMSEDTLLAVLSTDLSLVLMRMDRQDVSGTYLLTRVLRKLNKVCYILLNMVPPEVAKLPGLTDDISKYTGMPVLGLIPFYDEVLSNRSKGVFILKHPQHPYTSQVYQIAKTISSW